MVFSHGSVLYHRTRKLFLSNAFRKSPSSSHILA
jgi:hypothetical protein